MKQTLNGHRMPRAPPPSQSLQTPLNPLNNPMVPTIYFPSELLGVFFFSFSISILNILIEGSGGPGHSNYAAT